MKRTRKRDQIGAKIRWNKGLTNVRSTAPKTCWEKFKISWNVYFCLCINLYLSYKGDKAYWMCTVSPIVSIFVCYSSYFFVFTSFLIFSFFWDFVGISSANPHETTRPLGETKLFKGLVAYAKCNRDSYESELDL